MNPFDKKSDDKPVVGELKVVKEELKEEPEYMKILRAHGNQESNIPINSPYWRLRP